MYYIYICIIYIYDMFVTICKTCFRKYDSVAAIFHIKQPQRHWME